MYIAEIGNNLIRSITCVPLPTGATNVCVGSSTTLSDAIGGGSWSSAHAAIAAIDSASGIVTGVAAGTALISYTVTGFSGFSVTVIVTVIPSPAAVTGATSVCTGSSTTLADATAGGTWSSTDVTIATIGTAHIVTGVAFGTATISYTLPTGCYKTTTVTVNQSPSVTGTAILCAGTTTSLSDPGSGGGTWASSSTAMAIVGSGTGIVTGVAAGVPNITYTLPVTGCKKITPVTVNALPTTVTLGASAICQNATTTLTGAPAGGTWSSASSNISIVGSILTGVTAGSATVTYTLGTGCYKTANVTINTTPAGITGNNTICGGATLPLTETTTGGTWTSSLATVATIGTTGIVTGIVGAGGTSTISYTLGTCRATTVVTVLSTPTAATIAATSICMNATTTLTGAPTGGTWSSASSNVTTAGSILTGVSAGTATVTYTLGTGCYKTANVTINTTPAAITGNSTICGGTTESLGETTTGGVWASSLATVATIGTTGIVTGIVGAGGTSTISYTLGTCRATTVVTVLSTPTAATVATPTICMNATTTLTGAPIGGTWSSASSNVTTAGSILTGVSAGTATVTYTLGTVKNDFTN